LCHGVAAGESEDGSQVEGLSAQSQVDRMDNDDKVPVIRAVGVTVVDYRRFCFVSPKKVQRLAGEFQV